MEQKVLKRFSIPNLLTAFRLLLIPLILWMYAARQEYAWAVALLALSGVTDMADGYIARKCHMVSDLGKVLDPVADKLTQVAVVFCLAFQFPAMRILFTVLVAKEMLQGIMAYAVLRRTGLVWSAGWYGKLCTGIMYGAMIAHMLPNIDPKISMGLTALCIAACILSLTLYLIWDLKRIKAHSGRGLGVLLRSLLWTGILAAILLAFLSRSEITLESILSFTPENGFLAAMVLLLCFAAKSVTMVVYINLLYIAGGILFPLPLALAVNLAGTAIVLIIPYWIGRLGGREMVGKMRARYPRIEKIQSLHAKSNFLFAMLVRSLGILPADPVSIYLGANEMPFIPYLTGGLVGFLPALLVSTILGINAEKPGSPEFKTAVAVFVITAICTALWAALWVRQAKGKKKTEDT